jgi:hypothetical protein
VGVSRNSNPIQTSPSDVSIILLTFVSVGIKVSSASFQNRVCNGSQVDQGLAGKAQQEPEGEMEETETSGAAEAPAYLID